MLREEDNIAGENFCKMYDISIAAQKGEHKTPLDTNDVTGDRVSTGCAFHLFPAPSSLA